MKNKKRWNPGSDDGGAPLRRQSPETILEDCLERINAGERIDKEDIRKRYPDCAEELIERLDLLEAFGQDAHDDPSLGILGDFTIHHQIGRGGMGVVYYAWQNSMERSVALKVLPAGVAVDDRAFNRFMREA